MTFAELQDWSNPSCERCYYKWLATTELPPGGKRDSNACSGAAHPCLRYYPPLKPEFQEASCQFLASAINYLN